MMKKISSFVSSNKVIKNFATNYLTTIFFTILYNFIQLFVYRLLNRRGELLFAQLAFAIYIMTFFELANTVVKRYIIGKISINGELGDFSYIKTFYKNFAFNWIVILLFISILLVLFYPRHIVIILLCLLKALVGFYTLSFDALAYSLKKFKLLGSSSLIIPIFKILALLIGGEEVVILFVLFSFLSVIARSILLFLALATTQDKAGEMIILPNFDFSIKRRVIIEIVFQIFISSFWILDGLFLRRLMTDAVYAEYSTLAILLKPPLFLTLAAVNILLCQNIKNRTDVENNIKLSKLTSFLAILLFFSYLFVNYILDSGIFKLLGFEGRIEMIIMFVATLSWMLHSVIFITNLTIEKFWNGHLLHRFLVFIYVLSYLFSLFVGRNSTIKIFSYSSIQGAILFFSIFAYFRYLKSSKIYYNMD